MIVKVSVEYNFQKELTAVFPTIKIEKEEMKVDTDEFDLFLIQAYKYIVFYEKEIAKLEVKIFIGIFYQRDDTIKF